MTTTTPTATPLALIALLLATAGPAFAQAPPPPTAPPQATAPAPTGEKRRSFEIPKLGVDVGLFLPTSGKTRSRFGNTWSDIGLGIGRPDRPSGTGRVSLDFSTTYKKSGDHHAFVAPLGVSYRRAFNAGDLTSGSTFVPYYGIAADLVVVDLRSSEDNVHSRFRLSEGGSLVLGTTIGASGFAEGKYTAVAKIQGFDLSGLKLTVGIRF